jgi:sulfate adenylyltransferase
MKEFLLGGDLLFLEEIINHKEVFPRHNYTPKETRAEFARRGWQTVVAFQTRNVPHRGHEFLQKEALKLVDGLLVQPVIGKKKDQDFKDEYIVASYEALIDNYFDPERVMLGVLPLDMYYAGPKEALMHALIRKNFGCTHFIVGRDHAGVGDFYAPLAAQEIFEQFDAKELGIEILKFEEVTYDGRNQQPCFVSQCPREEQVNFSGTRLRQFLEKQKTPPEYLIRPEVYNILVNATNSLVDQMYQKENSNQKGFVLWFTGLSAAGKSTTADQVFKLLQKENGLRLERLDGDVVRENLTKELGFSKEDRDENIRRVGFVSDLLSRNGVGVIASFISPYRSQRGELREKVHNFIEVFVDASLKVCEERDPKGLYKKARTGEIKCFTGISDDYEIPKNPDLHLRTDQHSPEECAQKVVDYLRKQQLI